MTSQMRSVEEEVTLLGPDTLNARAGKGTAVVLRVVRRIEGGGGVIGKSLSTVPGHVLNSEQRAVGAQKHIKVAGANDGVVGVLDDTLQSTAVGRTDGSVGTPVSPVAEDVDVGTLQPIRVKWSVQRLLDVRAVEIDDRVGW
jgi:hypothetical protein